MGAVSRVAASRLRGDRRADVVIAFVVAVVVAVVLGAWAGARRTDDALRSFLASDRGADGYAFFGSPALGGTASVDLASERASIQAVPGVAHTTRFSDAVVELSVPSLPSDRLVVQGYVGLDPDGLAAVSRFHLVHGRLPNQAVAGEVLIDEELARDARLGVGSQVAVRAFTTDQMVSSDADAAAAGPEIAAEVVGVVRRPNDLRDPQERQLIPNDYVVHQDIYLTPAFRNASGGDVAGFNPAVAFELDATANRSEVYAAIFDATGGYVIDHERFLSFIGTFKGVERSVSLHARGLQALAAILAVAGLFVAGQTIRRQIVLEGVENSALGALGMSGRQLLVATLFRVLPVVAVGVLVGIVGAIGLSTLMPLTGTVARRAELHPGFSVDPMVLAGGGTLAVVLVTLAGLAPATRTSTMLRREANLRARPLAAVDLAARHVPVAPAVGVRFALEPGVGRNAVPVRTALSAGAVAVAVLVAAVIFSTTLSDTRNDPLRYGVTWDVAAGAMFSPEQADELADEVRAIPGVVAFSGISATALDTSAGEISVVLLRREKGEVTPLITDGRAPGPGEVALGALTMDERDLRIGDEFVFDDLVAGLQGFEISGVVALNVAGLDGSISPGRGALLDWSAIDRFDVPNGQRLAPSMFLVDAVPGGTQQVEDRLRAIFPTSTRAAAVEPLDLANLGDASPLSVALAGVMVMLGLASITHSMVTVSRRRQRDLATLCAIGFTKRDVGRAATAQALTFAAIALVVGLPIGVLLGRSTWSLAAHQLGIPSRPVLAFAPIAAAAIAFVLLVVLVATPAARRTARASIGAALRGFAADS